MKPLRFTDGNVGWVFGSVKRYWEEDVRGGVVLKDAAVIYQAQTDKELRERLKAFKIRWMYKEPKAVRAFIRGFDRTLTHREFTEPDKTLIKTNNPLERYLEELQRRIKPFRKFANAKSVDRIVYGIIAYVLDNRKSENTYNFTQFA